MITNPYSTLDRWLHWLALEPAVVRDLAFDLESAAYMPDNPAQAAMAPVYVCGLARSGTSLLLRLLDEVETLKSLTYRDMPFVLAPNLWRAAHGQHQRSAPKVMRAHKDDLFNDLDTPEALEEVFWKTFGHTVLDNKARTLDYQTPSPATIAAFTKYRALVANPKRAGGSLASPDTLPRRYLSKNNNNLMRLESLCADPSAHVLLSYRDPLATARSSHRLHKRFCKAQQAKDGFFSRYMRWLTHHEFGLDHLPFAFAWKDMDTDLKPEDPNYWLDYWCAVHQHIQHQQSHNLHLINYDSLCAQPERLLGKLLDTLALKAEAKDLAKMVRANTTSSPTYAKVECAKQSRSDALEVIVAAAGEFDPQLVQRALTIYAAFCASESNIVFV